MKIIEMQNDICYYLLMLKSIRSSQLNKSFKYTVSLFVHLCGLLFFSYNFFIHSLEYSLFYIPQSRILAFLIFCDPTFKTCLYSS